MKETWNAVLAHLDEDGLVDMAREALRIPSPPGEERAVAEFFVSRMHEQGIEAEIQQVPPDENMLVPSVNGVGKLAGTGDGPSLLFNGHMDHNPVCDGWTKDPFGGIIEDGWLYGFVHMKAADAAYIAALGAVRNAGISLKGDVLLTLVCGELRGGCGTKQSLSEGWTADYFILGEPTELETAVCHTASIVFDIHVLGAMKHFATVDVPGKKGINAVEYAAKVIAALGPSHAPLASIDQKGWLTFEPRSRFEDLPQLNIGSIRGGISRDHDRSRPALMPDVCTLTVDLRIVPGMDRHGIEADLVRLLRSIQAENPDFRFEIDFAAETFPHPFDSPPDSVVALALSTAHTRVTGTPPRESRVLKFAASDASWLGLAGIPGIIYGPTGKYLSRPDERGSIADIVTAARVYACVIADICGAA